ncbi:MAG: hypothetical protein K8I00_01730, partial [Candidatus Omnitrophica bacterium]|nr:hypothetical protein [Candidatus Omnitrophota bacterium]
HNTTFTISSLLTLNGSSGNEIILNSVDGSNRFTFAVTGGTQTVSYVNVSNSQASSNNIIANNSTNNTNTDSGESAPRWIFVVQPDLLIDTGRFTLTSGTGNLSVTGVGFQPSAYILFLTKNDTDDTNSAEGTGNGSMLSIGMTDGTRQFCMASGVEDNQGTADVGRRGFTDEVVCNIDVGDENQSVRGEANHVSFDADGFTINRGVTFSEPASVLVEYIAFGGSDLDVYVDTVDLNNTINNSVDVTGPGFEPDLVLSSFIGRLVDGTGNINNDDHSMSFGWAVNPAVQPANNQLSITTVSRDAVGTSETLTRFDTVRAGVTITDSTQAAAYEFANFDASGFDVTTRLAGAVANELMGYLALDVTGTAYIYSGTRTALTTAGNDIDGNAAFQPVFLMGVGSAVATAANTNTDGGSLTIGMTDGTDTLSMSIHDEDNADTSNTHSRTTNTQLLVGYADDGTVDWEASFTSFDESGYTLNYGDAASAGYLTGFLAIGLNAAPTTIFGTVLQSDQATGIGANRTVSLSVNGLNTVQSVETDASGNYNFNVDTDPADVVAVYIDDETENAVTVSVSDGNLLGGYDLYQDFLVIRNDNSGSTTNSRLALADNNGDSDITSIYTMSGNALTVAANVGLVVQAGQTYAPGNVVNANDVDINGIFAMAANAITISGSLDATGGTFTSSGTVTFDATDTRGILSNSNAFHNIVFNGATGTWLLQDPLDANGNLFILNGTLDVNAAEDNPVSVGGDWQNSASFLPRSGTVTFDGSGAQTLTTCNGCTAGDFYNVVVTNGSGSTVAFEDSFSVVNLTAVTADTSMTFEAGTTATISGNLSLNGGASGDEIIIN